MNCGRRLAHVPHPTHGHIRPMTGCRLVKQKSGFRKTSFFLKKPTHWDFGGFIGFYAFIGLSDFLCEQVVGKVVGWFSSSAKLLFRFVSTLDYLSIRRFITCWSLEAVNIKNSLIITGMTNWNWIKFAVFLLGFSSGFTQRNPACFLDIIRVSEPWQKSNVVAVVDVEPMVNYDDSDSSSSASTSYTTPASVAAFVKKVKRIRFNSITIAKDLPSTGRLLIPRPALTRATSCPGLLAMVADVGTPSSVSSSQHLLTISSPATSLRPTFAETCLSSPLSLDRISVATQTVMYVHSSESDVVTNLAPYESLVAQTIPFAPFIQCYACLHGRQPNDEATIKTGVWTVSVCPFFGTRKVGPKKPLYLFFLLLLSK